MKLNLIRRPAEGLCTFGELTIDNVHECNTLERRGVQIPCGTYPVELTISPHFHRLLPLLDSVPGRSDIRIHTGNWPRDTEGCILVGLKIGEGMILQSQLALDPLVTKIKTAIDNGEKVTISVT